LLLRIETRIKNSLY